MSPVGWRQQLSLCGQASRRIVPQAALQVWGPAPTAFPASVAQASPLSSPSSGLEACGPPTTMAAKQPPPLMKKHSQTDLVSRLKTRKILGVGGEDDDGEVHRSKVRGTGSPVV